MSQTIARPILSAHALQFVYPYGTSAISGLSLDIAEGTIVGLLGVNGSGKTTLLRLLMRLLKPSEGCVCLEGRDIQNMQARELYRRIGLLFQNPADQLFAASVERDVAFGPQRLGLDNGEISDRVEEALAAVDAWDLRHREVHQLSYGQQKRVALAGVLAMEPSILLLDEPTGGLDPTAESQMVRLLLQLNRERGATLVFSTHNVDLLPVLADRLCVLRDGQVIEEGTPAEVFFDPDSIARAGLRLPLITQLFDGLVDDAPELRSPLPLTVEQGRRRILDWIAEVRTAAQRLGERP